MNDPIQYKLLGKENASLLNNVAEGVLDYTVQEKFIDDFLRGNQNVFFIAVRAATVLGMVSGVIYNHPDKPRELWINEIGVTDEHRQQGIARGLLEAITEYAKRRGCVGAWVLTEDDNIPANALYRSMKAWSGPKEQVMYWVDI